VLSSVLRLVFCLLFVMLSTEVLVGIAGKPYYFCEVFNAKLMEHGWLGVICGCHSKLWYKPR
jgi:hypothetical protein